MAEKIMFEGASGAITHVSASNPLPINIVSGGGGGSATASDNFANPTDASKALSFGMLWDGATWDRMPGDSTYGVKTQDTLIPQSYDNTLLTQKVNEYPHIGSTYTWTPKSSSALEFDRSLKASAGNLKSFKGWISATAPTGVYYVLFYNSNGTPAPGAAVSADLLGPIAVNHTTGTATPITGDDIPANGVNFSSGIYVCLSTTAFTKSMPASAYLCITYAGIK